MKRTSNLPPRAPTLFGSLLVLALLPGACGTDPGTSDGGDAGDGPGSDASDTVSDAMDAGREGLRDEGGVDDPAGEVILDSGDAGDEDPAPDSLDLDSEGEPDELWLDIPPRSGVEGDLCGWDDHCEAGLHCSNGACAPLDYAYIHAGSFNMGMEVVPGVLGELAVQGQVQSFELPRREVTVTYDYLIGETELREHEWVDRDVWGEGLGIMPPFESPRTGGFGAPALGIPWVGAAAYTNMMSVRDGLDPCYVLENCRMLRMEEDYTCESWDLCPDWFYSYSCRENCDEVNGYCNCPVMHCDTVGFAGLDCTGWRLPTEAEWEYAARGGQDGGGIYRVPSRTEFETISTDCDDENNPFDAVAWYACNTTRIGFAGVREPNAWGLYDVAGNAIEWVTGTLNDDDEGFYGDNIDPYWFRPEGDRNGTSETPAGSAGIFFVVRGGSYLDPGVRLLHAIRQVRGSFEFHEVTGFRVARRVFRDGE